MFDAKGFLSAKFEARTEAVEVPALAPWFPAGTAPTPVMVVRGLTGQELARVREAAEQHRGIGKMQEALVGGSDKEKIAAVRQVMGIGDELPEDFAKRVEMLVVASVEPKLNLEAVLKLATAFPVEFYTLTNTIKELTGLGHTVPGKPAPSTATAGFEQP